IPLGKELTAVDRAKISIEAELEREKQQRLAQETEEDRKRRLDKITFANGQFEYGELAGAQNENRYKFKQTFEKLRTDPSLSEPERNDRLKKMLIPFKVDKKGKLGRAQPYNAEQVVAIALADTPENRYRWQLLDANPKDLNQQLDLAK